MPLRTYAPATSTNVGDLIYLTNLDTSDSDLTVLGSKHTLHSGADLLDSIVNDTVQTDINAVTLCVFCSNGVGTNIEAYDDGIGCACKHNVALGNSTNCAVDDLYADLIVGELFKRLLDCLNGALNVSLDDDRQLLDLALLDLAEQVVKSNLLVLR